MYCLPFLPYGFDAVTLSDANARVLDRCVDRAVYRIFGVCDNDNVTSVRTVLGLHGVSNLVKNRRAKFLEGLFDTASAALMHIHYTNCLGGLVLFSCSYCPISVCLFVCACVFVCFAAL